MDSGDVMKQFLKLQRERNTVKVAHISDTLKLSLLKQIDEKMKELEMSVGGNHVGNVKK